jgi:hypothetical protein
MTAGWGPRVRSHSFGAICALVGAVVSGFSLFLPWQSACFGLGGFSPEPLCDSIPGLTAFGVAAAGAALATFPLAILSLTLHTRQARLGLALGILGCASLMAIRTVLGFTEIGEGFAPQAGLWVALGGTILLTVGGALAVFESLRLPR